MLFVFEGGHQAAPSDTQFNAFLWMLEGKKFYKGLTADLEAIRKTVKFDGDKNIYSSPGVHKYANKIFSKIDFEGMSKEIVLAILGNPGSLNEFALPKEKQLDSPLFYIFADGVAMNTWQVYFKDGKVTSVKQVSL